MPTSRQIYLQIQKLTQELIGASLCDNQNFPATRPLRDGLCEIGFNGDSNISSALKSCSYTDIYNDLLQNRAYNLKMLDGALIQMMYRFRNEQIEAHRLAFFPSPFLEKFQNNPHSYMEDEIYADIIKRNIIPSPLRFDFDGREEVAIEITHPKSHLTIGQYECCRIPVSAPLTPYLFINFILDNFYLLPGNEFNLQLKSDRYFSPSISTNEKKIIYVQIPSS